MASKPSKMSPSMKLGSTCDTIKIFFRPQNDSKSHILMFALSVVIQLKGISIVLATSPTLIGRLNCDRCWVSARRICHIPNGQRPAFMSGFLSLSRTTNKSEENFFIYSIFFMAPIYQVLASLYPQIEASHFLLLTNMPLGCTRLCKCDILFKSGSTLLTHYWIET